MNFNPIMASAGLQVDNFVEDTTPPELISYDLDMNSDLLRMTFSETVDADTIQYNYFILLNAPNSTDRYGSYMLTGGDSTQLDSTMINLTFSKVDSDEIRRLYNLATSNETTYFTVQLGGILDMNANPLVSVNESDPFPVREFTPDTTEPELISFDLDLNANQLFLTFSETVDITTFDLEQIAIISTNDSNTTIFEHTLTGGYFTMENSTMITLNLTLEDLNQIKRLPGLAVSPESTYISITDMLIDDMNANNVKALRCAPNNSCDVIQVTFFTEDITRPELLAFDLNLTSEVLTLYFSETVNTTSLDVSQITLHFATNTTGDDRLLSFSPTNTFTLTPFNDIVAVELGLDDLNELKRIRGLAVDESTTFISITRSTILDMNGNEVIPLLRSSALQVQNFTDDSINPELEAYELDLNTGTLILSFTETIDILSLNISKISFQPLEFVPDANFSFTLTHGSPPLFSSTETPDSHIVIINIGTEDLNGIKRIKELAREPNATYLVIPEDFVSDMSGNPIVALPNGMARRVDNYFPDQNRPLLLSYSLNLTSELLILTFNETVDVSTLNITFLVLQSADSVSLVLGSGSASGVGTAFPSSGLGTGSGSGSGLDVTPGPTITTYTLTSTESVTEIDGPVVTIALTDVDLHEIKLLRNLASNPNNTYLTLREGAFYDNALIANPSQELTQNADIYGFDTTPPQLSSFSVDINAGTIALNFDEPVDRSTLDPTGLVLQGSETFTHLQQRLRQTGGTSPSFDGLMILLRLSSTDLNELKRNDMLYTNIETAYLTVDSIFVQDMAGNPIAPIVDGNARQASAYRNDTTMPRLLGYSLDMDLGTLNLSFSETVNVSSLQFNQLTLQRSSNASRDQYQYTLTGGSLLSERDDTTVYIQISDDDLNAIKARTIANAESTTWLVFPSDAILDMNRQEVEARVNGLNAAAVDNYTADTTQPQLLLYTLNLTSGVIEFTFSETVNVQRSLNPVELTFQNREARLVDIDGLNFYTLSSSNSSESPNSPTFSITLSLDDLNAIKQSPTLATTLSNTYIAITTAFIQDMVANVVVEIPPNGGFQATEVAPDTIRPVLQDFDLDLTAETLTLYFSETVDLSTFDLTQFTLVESELGMGESGSLYTLTGGSMRSLDGPTVQVILTTPDLNAIKRLFALATDVNNTYISITAAALTDMSALPVVPISISDAKQVRRFTPDQVDPRLVAFSLDLDGSGKLILTFDETVNSRSLDITQVSLQDNTTASVFYQFRSSSTPSQNGTIISVDITAEDLNNIKRVRNLATSTFDTYITLTVNTIEDMNENNLSAIVDRSAVGVRRYTADTTQPQLLAFSIDVI